MMAHEEVNSNGISGNDSDTAASNVLAQARKDVGRLCELTGVNKVVIVDDELEAKPEFENLVGRYVKLRNESPETLAKIPQFESIDREGDLEDIRPDLQEVWDSFDEPKQDELLAELGWITGQKTFAALTDLLTNQQTIFLSLKQWRDRKEELTTPEALAESLYLFDLDMEKEGGAIDEGMRTIQSLLRGVTGQCLCGLLSHLVAEDNEYEDWQTFVQNYDLHDHKDRFAVISKKHLPASPMAFAQRLKRVAITSHCVEIREKVEGVLDDAFSEAKGKLASLNVYDFEEIVFQSSYAEGVWEPDTLLRVLSLHTQQAARNLLKSNRGVESLASKIRSVVDIGFRPDDAPVASSRKIMRLELYEDASFLSNHHIPLDLGDIFRRTTGATEFVLLAQPCDIMCRNIGDDRAKEVLVAKIIEMPIGKMPSPDPKAYWKLIEYSTDTNKVKYVDFRSVSAIPIMALDMTVFNNNGLSSFKVGSPCPASVIPSWQRLHQKINRQIGVWIRRFENSVSIKPKDSIGESRKLVADALTGSVQDYTTGKFDLKNSKLTYDVKRVSRVKPPRAASLFRSYTAFLTRDGFDHELTRRMD